jgi:hypothetical protein
MKRGFEIQETGCIIGVVGFGRNIIKSEPGVGINAFKKDVGAIFHSGTQWPDRRFSIPKLAGELPSQKAKRA